MPYASNAELPDSVRNALPAAAQSRFRTVVNSALDRGLSDSAAFASAWTVIRNGWKKDRDGNWVRIQKVGNPNHDDKGRFSSGDGGSGGGGKELRLPTHSDEAVVYDGEIDGNYSSIQVQRTKDGYYGQVSSEEGSDFDFTATSEHELRSRLSRYGATFAGVESVKKRSTAVDDIAVAKVNEDLGLVIGWAIISKIAGQDYFDLQGDNIPEDSMLKASMDYMLNHRVTKEMHFGDQKGSVVFAWPMTEEIAKAMGISSNVFGLMIGMKPDNPESLAKFKDGTYTGFSIGGRRVIDEEVN